MSTTIELPSVTDYMKSHVVEVFETMLATKAHLLEGHPVPETLERVSGSVGFAGETINGAVYLHLTPRFATKATATLLGLPAEEPVGEADINDAVGEFTNMLTGGLKSWLCDSGAACAVSTPAIIRGTAFAIEPGPNVQRETLVFDCQGDTVTVELHVKTS